MGSAPSTAQYTISVSALSGFGATVTFQCLNLPASVTCSFSPPTVTGSGSTTMTLSSNNEPTGNYAITVVGVGVGAATIGEVVAAVVSPGAVALSVTATR